VDKTPQVPETRVKVQEKGVMILEIYRAKCLWIL